MKCVSHGKQNRIYSNDDGKLIKPKKNHTTTAQSLFTKWCV